MKRIFILILFIGFYPHTTLKADSYDSLDARFWKLFLNNKEDKAFSFADSICEVAQKKEDRILQFLCLHFKAQQEEQGSGKLNGFKAALEFADKNPEVNDKYTISVYQSIAQFYGGIEDFDKSLEYLEKAVHLSRLNGDFKLPNILSVKSTHHLAQGDTVSALKAQKEVLSRFASDFNEKSLNLNKYIYFFLKKEADSLLYYGEKTIAAKPNLLVQMHIGYQLGRTYSGKKETKKAIAHFKQVLEHGKSTNDHKIIYETAMELVTLYLEVDSTTAAKKYQELSKVFKDSLVNVETYRDVVEAEQTKNQNNFIVSQWLLIIGGVLLGLLLIYVLFRKKSSRTDKPTTVDQKEETSERKFRLNEQAYGEIERKMTLFFEEKLFLNQDCTMDYVVNKLEIKNRRYLREYVKIKYDLGFTDFINKLRIEYVIKKLGEDKIFRNYTTEGIAQESGFSSRAVFSKVFKKITGESPSDYIKKLQ